MDPTGSVPLSQQPARGSVLTFLLIGLLLLT